MNSKNASILFCLIFCMKRGYEKVSLSVQKANYAVKLYEKTGFKNVDENEEEYIMVRDW